jgi:uncharacterized protein YpiB (UPF0302 family)
MDRMVPTTEALRNLIAELVLEQAIREYKERELYQKIDEALAQGDEALFLVLTGELRKL